MGLVILGPLTKNTNTREAGLEARQTWFSNVIASWLDVILPKIKKAWFFTLGTTLRAVP